MRQRVQAFMFDTINCKLDSAYGSN